MLQGGNEIFCPVPFVYVFLEFIVLKTGYEIQVQMGQSSMKRKENR
jgi:hypothetical protein